DRCRVSTHTISAVLRYSHSTSPRADPRLPIARRLPIVHRGSRLAPSTGMTTSTSKDDPTATKPAAAIVSLIADKTQPGLASPNATSEADLESRIKQRRAELIGKLGELTADTRLA